MKGKNMNDSKHTPGPRFSKLQDVYLTRRIPGTEYVTGDRVTVVSVVNNGTKRNPAYRYYVRGAWLDEDAMSEANTEEA